MGKGYLGRAQPLIAHCVTSAHDRLPSSTSCMEEAQAVLTAGQGKDVASRIAKITVREPVSRESDLTCYIYLKVDQQPTGVEKAHGILLSSCHWKNENLHWAT